MFKTILTSKLHNLIVTGAKEDYIGSISLDPLWMETSKIDENEQVHCGSIWTNTNKLYKRL